MDIADIMVVEVLKQENSLLKAPNSCDFMEVVVGDSFASAPNSCDFRASEGC